MAEVYLGNAESNRLINKQDDAFSKSFADSNLKKGFKNVQGTARSKQEVDDTVYSITDCVEPPYNLKYLSKLYETSSIHAAAVDAKVDNVVGFGWRLNNSHRADQLLEQAGKDTNESDRDSLEKKFDKKRLEIEDYLSDLNNIDEFDEILSKAITDLFTTGNGYIEVARDAEGQVAYIGHVSAVDIRIRRNRDGFIQHSNSMFAGTSDPRVVFFRNFGDTKTKDPSGADPNPNELIHFKNYSPTNTFYGVPDIVSAIEAVAGIEFASKYNLEYFENKAIPKYVVKIKNMDLDSVQLSKLSKLFESTKSEGAHRTVFIPIESNGGGEDSDILFEPIESGKQEGSFKDYTESNLQTILARHRTPKSRLGITDGQGLSSSRDAEKVFKESVCRPIQRLVEKKMQKVLKTITNLFDFKLIEYSLTDEDTQSVIDDRDIKNGSIVPDERRARLGLKRRQDGNGDEPAGQRDLQELAGKLSEKAAKVAAKNAPKPVVEDQSAPGRAEDRAQGNRTRDRDRSANNPDSTNTNSTRNAKGEGRQTS